MGMFGRESREDGMCMDCVTVPCLCDLLVLERRLGELKKETEVISKTEAELVETETGEEDWQADEDWLTEEAARAEAELAEEEAEAGEAAALVEEATEAGKEDCLAGVPREEAEAGEEVELVEEEAEAGEEHWQTDPHSQAEAQGEKPDWINKSPESKITLEKLGEGEKGGEKAYDEICKESSASQYEGPQAEQGEGAEAVLGEGEDESQVGLLEGQGTSEGTLTPPEPTPGIVLEGQGQVPGALTPQCRDTGDGIGDKEENEPGKHPGEEEGAEGNQVGLLEGQGTSKGTLTPPEPVPRVSLEGQGTRTGTLTPRGKRGKKGVVMDCQEPKVKSLMDRMREKARVMEEKNMAVKKSPARKRKKTDVGEDDDAEMVEERKKMRNVLENWMVKKKPQEVENVDNDKMTVEDGEKTVESKVVVVDEKVTRKKNKAELSAVQKAKEKFSLLAKDRGDSFEQ